jgi:hypothetical protein
MKAIQMYKNNIASHAYPFLVKDMVMLNLNEKVAGRQLGWENGLCPVDASLSFWVGWLDARRDAGHINATPAQIKYIRAMPERIGCIAPWQKDLDDAIPLLKSIALRQKVIIPKYLKSK